MKLYSSNESYKLYQGNMLDMLDVIESNSIDSIITDPPYELNFMSKGWDNAGVSFQVDTWKKCYEVLKPGGYLLAFGGSRTFHRIACAIEDAGFEIRDTIMWIYGMGFPKSMNIGLALDKKNGVESEVIGTQVVPDIRGDAFGTMNEKQGGSYNNITREIKKATNEWQGWGTALKPSFEPIIVARKPFKGSLVDNVIKNGVGGINIDECRVETNDKNDDLFRDRIGGWKSEYVGGEKKNNIIFNNENKGRFPANTILTYDETDFDEVCGGFPNTKSGIAVRHNSGGNTFGGNNKKPPMEDLGYNDSGSASRYFYNAKASKKDRDCNGTIRNIHPTCKPCNLMQYLVRLVTPNNGIILDPFNGSGSTGKAVIYENKERNKNYKYIGIELTEEYLPISKARIEYVCKLAEEEKNKERQLSIYDLQ